MRRAPSIAEFADAPEGRFLAGRGWITFCAGPALWGFALRGQLRGEDGEALVQALSLELGPSVSPHASLVDTRGLAGVEPAAFTALERYVRRHRVALGRQVRRLAVVRSGGLEGAVVSGFFGVLPAPFPVHVCADVEGALAALRVEAKGLPEALARALDETGGAQAISEQVRALLSAEPRRGPEELARALGVSVRTLQRQLAAAGSSLRDEKAAVRLALALSRIRETDAPLTSIALDAGYASLQHMGRAVRRATGRSPSELRRTEPPEQPPRGR